MQSLRKRGAAPHRPSHGTTFRDAALDATPLLHRDVGRELGSLGVPGWVVQGGGPAEIVRPGARERLDGYSHGACRRSGVEARGGPAGAPVAPRPDGGPWRLPRVSRLSG